MSPQDDPPSWIPPAEGPGPSWQPQPPSWESPSSSGHGQQQGYGQQPGYPQQQYQQPAHSGGPGWRAAPKPGIIALRPLAVGEILDGAFTTIRRYPRATLGLSAIVAGISGAVNFLLSLNLRGAEVGDPTDPTMLAVSGVTSLVSALAGLILTGMLTLVISEAVLGRHIDIGDIWGRVRSRLGSLIGASLLVGLLVVIGTIACVLPGIYLYVSLAFTTPVLILEGQRVTAAMGRSRALVAGDWWRVFGILLLAFVISLIITAVITIPFAFAGGNSSPFGIGGNPFAQPSTAQLAWQALGGLIATTLTAPISAGVAVLLYIDRRMRREGLDLALARAAAESPPGLR